MINMLSIITDKQQTSNVNREKQSLKTHTHTHQKEMPEIKRKIL